jgi:hypothetical protein
MRIIKSSALMLSFAMLMAVAAPSQARLSSNGRVLNGTELNTRAANSRALNSRALNGRALNSRASNSRAANSAHANTVVGDGAFAGISSIKLADGTSFSR